MENNSQEIKYYLGIDGGGTKTDFMLANNDGNVIARKIIRGCNPNDVGIFETYRVLKEGIDAVCQSIPRECISAFAGLAGCSSAENLPIINEYLKEFGFGKYSNYNDALNAMAVGLRCSEGIGDGVAVIMGTGSIAYAKKGSELYRIGGYGYLFGDKGSGFSIGKDTVLAALQCEDGMGKDTVIYDMVKKQCGGDTVLSKIDSFYKNDIKEIAKYAPIAFDAYSLGDEVALGIINDNIGEIAKMIKTGAKKLESDSVRVALLGGLTAREDIIIPLLYSFLEGDKTTYKIEACKKPPVIGALYLAGLNADI